MAGAAPALTVAAALAAGPVPAPPATVVAALTHMEALIEQAGACVTAHPRWGLESGVRERESRLLAAVEEVREIWSPHADPSRAPPSAERPPPCARGNVLASFASFDRVFEQYRTTYAAATAPMGEGLWLGSLRICGAEAAGEERPEGEPPAISIILPPRLQAALAALTEAAVGHALALRLDGRIVSRPYVSAPIRGRALALIGTDAATAARIAPAAAAPCRAAG